MERLHNEVAAYFTRQPYLIPDKLEVEGEWRVQRFFIKEPPDVTWALIVSETIHHLRSALDNLVWQLVLVNHGKPTKRNQFPIFTCPPRPGRFGTMLRGVRADHRARIEDLQPYDGDDSPTKAALALLVDASNVDKHRFLHPVLTLVREPNPPKVVAPLGFTPTRTEIRYTFGSLEDGAKIFRYRIRAPGKAKVDVQGEATIEIVFGEGRLGGDTLDELRIRVLEIIEGFNAAFP